MFLPIAPILRALAPHALVQLGRLQAGGAL